MSDIDIVVEICGSAGDGTISAGEILSRYMSEAGYEIMSFDSYPAEIRGFGKCVAHSRIGSSKVLTPGKLSDVLISLNDIHSISQIPYLKEDGIVIYDSHPPKYHEEDKSVVGWLEPRITSYGVPLFKLANKAAGNSRGRNMVALGAFAALFGIDPEGFKNSIKKRYAKKKQIVIDSNVKSFAEGYEWTSEKIKKLDTCTFKCSEPVIKHEKIILTGNQSVVKGAVDAGLHFYAGYPITPATKIMELLSKELPKTDGVLLQTEDEIAAIGAVIGAGFGGKRAMTATSGPGLSLMTEFIGLSIMAEHPAVIVNSQRSGPSTGMPTKTEQSDLNMAIFGGTGDSPRIVLAPTNVEECYQATVLSLYLAEKYQTLVILLLDAFLSNSIRNISVPEKPDKNMLNANLNPESEDLSNYKRYKVTDNGVSPRAIPGLPKGMYFSTGLEHNEFGHPRYDGENHLLMTEKRYRKMDYVKKEMPAPEISGDDGKVEIGVISWGSSAGAAHEAVKQAIKSGRSAAAFSSMAILPLPLEQIIEFADRCEKLIIPELNHTGQYANIVSRYIKIPIHKLSMITGLPMASEDILEKMGEI